MLLSLLYVALMIAANVFATLWMVPLPFGLVVPAGVFFFAPLFTLRDRIQVDRGIRWIYALIVVTALLSWLTGWFTGMPLLEKISLASVLAFLVSESLDTLLFTVIECGFVQKAFVSNLFSSFFDSLIFVSLAFGLNWRIIIGQWIVKVLVSALVIPLVRPKHK